MNGSVSITWNKYTRVLECTLESRSIGSDRPMHPSQLGDRSREGPGRGFIRWVEDQEAFITSHSGGGCVHPSQISHLLFAAVLCSAFARSLAADVSIEGTRAGEKRSILRAVPLRHPGCSRPFPHAHHLTDYSRPPA